MFGNNFLSLIKKLKDFYLKSINIEEKQKFNEARCLKYLNLAIEIKYFNIL